jgi:surface protein
MRARLERAWSGLSLAEQLALGGGTLAVALAGGGLLLRSGLNARLLSRAEMRAKTTKDLLVLFGSSGESQKDAIARFCVCRVHDVRDELLEALGQHARSLLMRLANPEWRFTAAQIRFIETALKSVDYDLNELDDLDYEGDGKARGEAIKNAENSGTTLTPFLLKLKAVQDSEKYKNGNSALRKELLRALRASSEDKKADDSLRKEFLKILWGREKITNELGSKIARVNRSGYHEEHYKYGHIETWDVREVTDMSYAFAPSPNDRDLPRKEGPFWEAKAVEPLDLSFWDTRNVKRMVAAFKGYRGDVRVGMWDTRNVTDMSMAFADAEDFNGDIGNWDTSSVTAMIVMFHNAKKFDQDLSRWNMGSVRNDGAMFRGSGMERNEKKKPKVRMEPRAAGYDAKFGRRVPGPRVYV